MYLQRSHSLIGKKVKTKGHFIGDRYVQINLNIFNVFYFSRREVRVIGMTFTSYTYIHHVSLSLHLRSFWYNSGDTLESPLQRRRKTSHLHTSGL